MKKKRIFVLTVCVCLLGLAAIAALSRRETGQVGPSKPFKDLQASEIISVSVTLTPPDTTILIYDESNARNDAQMKDQINARNELVECLKKIVIYNKDNSYRDYVGQYATFTLTMADGTQKRVMAYNPFFVINGVGYKTKYEPCEALNSYANRLLELQQAD